MPKTKENWRPVKDYEGFYEVSDQGRICSFHVCSKGRLMKLAVDSKGYHYVNLYKHKKPWSYRVHRMVLEAFVGTHPEDKPECCHNNRIRTDNRLENLRWGSRQDNVDDTIIHNTKVYGERVGGVRLTEVAVIQIREDYATNKYSQQELADRYGVKRKTIAFVVHGETWKHVSGPITKMTPGAKGIGRQYLTEEIVRNVKTRYAAGRVSQETLAREHGIAQTTVSALLRNKIEKWQHIQP